MCKVLMHGKCSSIYSREREKEMTTAEGEREGRESMILLYLLEEDLERKNYLLLWCRVV